MITTSIKLNGIEIRPYVLEFEIERMFGQAVASISITAVKAIDIVLVPDVGQTIEAWRDSTKIFSGFMEKVEPFGAKYTLTGKDKIADLVRKEVVYSYDSGVDPSAGKISEIFIDLITTWGGLNADSSSVQDSGTTITLSKFICNHTDVFERCKTLADTMDWQFYYRPDTDKVYFEPLGFTISSDVLTVGDNIAKIPKWDVDNTEMMNNITIIGAKQLVETTELFNGDGFTFQFSVTKGKPESVKVYVNGTLMTGGAQNSTLAYDYYVDQDGKKIIFVVAPGIGTGNIQINYSYGIPTPVTSYDSDSITKYGEYKKTLFLNDIVSVEDAENRLANLLAKYSTPFLRVLPKVIPNPSSLDIQVGRKVRVVDAINDKDVFLVVNKQIMSYPEPFDSSDMGDKVWRLAEWGAKMEEKIHRLEEQAAKSQDLLLHVVSVGVDWSFARDSITIVSRTIGDTWITGHPTPSVRETPHKSGNFRSAYSTVYSKAY